ncbi:MAG: DUF1858 domain-containing protein [Bacteroidales bacterium]|nr:MAG: DUF1858 domain-containing protein [Bacteroidales bacterium]
MAPKSKFMITPRTKVGELLDNYPELEAKLIELAPTFRKLKNPILKKTIARITSLQQAAIVGNVPLSTMINELRREAGQDEISIDTDSSENILTGTPGWYDKNKVTISFDACPVIERGESPVALIFKKIENLGKGEIFELITPFVPAPVIDKLKEKGYNAWFTKAKNVVKTYFYKQD